jgi:type IX secretion system PorP/SprF family membrane protein
MNSLIAAIFILALSLNLSGQMLPLSDHYIYNSLSINPAFAGCHEALSATISYRNQWIGFTDSPKSKTLSVHSPVYNDRMGLGVLFENNSIGIFSQTNMMANYAYRRELHNGKLAMGLGFGITSYNMAWDKLLAADSDDDLLINNPVRAVLPNFSAGVYYYSKKYFIGFSLPLFISHKLNPDTNKYRMRNDFSRYNYFFTGGYEMNMGNQISILPSVLLKYHSGNPVQLDYNAQLNLKDRVWVGFGYRNRDMLVGLLQVQLNYQIRMAYSHNYNIGEIGSYLNGSHEFLLSYVFSYERKVVGPRHF